MSQLLDYIASMPFALTVGLRHPAETTRSLIRSLPEFALYFYDRKAGRITLFDLRAFIADQLSRLARLEVRGVNASLAFLCAVFEEDTSPYAHIFLHVLASAEVRELALATRVARVCLEHRKRGEG